MFLSRREQLHTKTCNIWIRFTCWKYDLNHFALACSIKFGDKMIGFMGQSKLESCWILPFCGQIPQGFPRLRPVGPRIIRLIQFVQNSVKLLLQRLNSLESSTDMPNQKNLETSEFCFVDNYRVPNPTQPCCICNERITKIGRRTNCMWTGLWSLGAMWRKMIQFWEIMEHQKPR